MTTLLIAVFLISWTAAAIATQAYFRGEQTKPNYDSNLRSLSFEQLTKSFTGKEMNCGEPIPVRVQDTYNSNNLPRR